MLLDHPGLMDEHGIIPEHMRTTAEILAAEEDFFDKVWYVRSQIHEQKIVDGQEDALTLEIARVTAEARARVEERRGHDLGPSPDWEWGFVNGKLSALRWVLGEEWDFLDT